MMTKALFAVVCLGAMASACGSAESASVGTGASSEPASAQAHVVTGSIGMPSQGTVLFTDQGENGVEMTAVDFGNDQIALSVGGPIATAKELPSGATIEQIYLSMHPGASVVPATILEVSQRVEALQAAVPESTSLPAAKPAIVDKDDGFSATVCKEFVESSWKWDPWICILATGTGAYVDGQASSNDRTYVWNDEKYSARVEWWSLCPNNYLCTPNQAVTWTIPPYWWNFFTIATPPSVGVGWQPDMVTSGPYPQSNLGITLHKVSFSGVH